MSETDANPLALVPLATPDPSSFHISSDDDGAWRVVARKSKYPGKGLWFQRSIVVMLKWSRLRKSKMSRVMKQVGGKGMTLTFLNDCDNMECKGSK